MLKSHSQVGRGSTELLNLAWNAFLRAATTADHLRTKAAGVSAQRAEQEAKPSELHRLQAEVTILRGELERSESRGTMLTQQVKPDTAMQKLRIVTQRGAQKTGDRKWSLNDGQIPNFRAVYVNTCTCEYGLTPCRGKSA